jgi:hypothetical protein
MQRRARLPQLQQASRLLEALDGIHPKSLRAPFTAHLP